ncbi:MAG: allophanate hydrolase [Phyllobacterium sp.]|uniref:allophanate hydrolase n=1 Tax=Phyllobacterium sp. TaxID=1871046 RepID=UPI0030F36C5A
MTGEHAFDIKSLHAAYAAGWPISDMIETVFSRLEAVDDPGIFLHLANRDALLNEAASLGAFDPVARPLWGIPFAVKDNIDVAGMPTTAACPDFAYLPDKDATVVRLLRKAGALVFGKTNLDQVATGLVGVRTPFPVPRNAIDRSLVPGGSSSGSAVATAHGIVTFALGTDTAGSGRIPAGLNNIVGLKPSVGALSTSGVVPACRTLDCVSIFALTTDDAWTVFSLAAKYDPTDAYSKSFPAIAYGHLPPVLRIGVPRTQDRQFFGDPAMESAFGQALDTLTRLGHQITEVPFADFYATANLLYEGAWVAERYAAVKDFFDSREDAFHPVTRTIYGGAKTLSAADAFNGLYALQSLKHKLASLIASVDLFCVPTAPRHYTRRELEAEPIRENSRLGTYTNFVNLLDMCGIAVPTGRRSDGLPASVTLLAVSGKDGLTARLARDLHTTRGMTLGATEWGLPASHTQPEIVENDLIDLAVVGAHLSGMPLNGQLRALNARFSRTASTTAAYRLYSLAGQTPARPGLVRSSNDDGAPIELEVWQLTPEAFGLFVAAIPPPLGIGSIQLSDGTWVKGFLAESASLQGAQEISGYGGWRAYVDSLATP